MKWTQFGGKDYEKLQIRKKEIFDNNKEISTRGHGGGALCILQRVGCAHRECGKQKRDGCEEVQCNEWEQ